MVNKLCLLGLLLMLAAACKSTKNVNTDSDTLINLGRREKYLNSENSILASKVMMVLPRAMRDEVAMTGDRIIPLWKEGENLKQRAMGNARVTIRELEILADESIEIMYEESTLDTARIYILAEGYVTHSNPQRILRGMKTLEIENDELRYTGTPTMEKK